MGSSIRGDTLAEAATGTLEAMGAQEGGLITLYYGGVTERKGCAAPERRAFATLPVADVEYYYGGMKNAEYWISLDE